MNIQILSLPPRGCDTVTLLVLLVMYNNTVQRVYYTVVEDP